MRALTTPKTDDCGHVPDAAYKGDPKLPPPVPYEQQQTAPQFHPGHRGRYKRLCHGSLALVAGPRRARSLRGFSLSHSPKLRTGGRHGRLVCHEPGIHPASPDQFAVCAALDYRTLVQDDDAVCANDAGETVRNDERRTTDHQALQGFLNEGFILRIDARQGFVEEEDRVRP